MKPVVTAEQIGRCHEFFIDGNRSVWGVESESTLDTDGRPLEYCVYLDTNSCSCPAFHHSKGQECKHILWCRAAQREMEDALVLIGDRAAISRKIYRNTGRHPSDETVSQWIIDQRALESEQRATAPIQRKAFSLMR